MNGLRLFRTLIVATVLAAVALACALCGLYDGTQARMTGQGTYCWRIGRRLNENGDVAGATWSNDGGETWTY